MNFGERLHFGRRFFVGVIFGGRMSGGGMRRNVVEKKLGMAWILVK